VVDGLPQFYAVELAGIGVESRLRSGKGVPFLHTVRHDFGQFIDERAITSDGDHHMISILGFGEVVEEALDIDRRKLGVIGVLYLHWAPINNQEVACRAWSPRVWAAFFSNILVSVSFDVSSFPSRIFTIVKARFTAFRRRR
jgi:hypothetical protein